MEENKYLKDYYEAFNEDGRLLSRNGHVEYTTTMTYIHKYLRPGMRVLEIGAGTGRYSRALAKEGYRVDAVELIEHNIRVFQTLLESDMQITLRQGDARDLSCYESDMFDLTLLLGPMYHLYTEEDKLAALGEAVRVTRPGGVVMAAYCMGDASILQYGFGRGHIHEIIRDCMLDTETFETYSHPWDIFELCRKEDIDQLRCHFAVTPLHYLAADGYAPYMREQLAQMDDETYALFLKYHLATCERADMTGYSNHVLDIFRKE